MNRRVKATIAAALLLFLFLLISCSYRFIGDDDTLYTGDRLTPDMIDSIFNEISESVTERYPIETFEDGRAVVYWVAGGSVWHQSSSCASIQNADPASVFSGDIYQAYSEGKDRGCKVCSKDSEITVIITESQIDVNSSHKAEITEKYPKEYDANGNIIVFWLENGSVWHESAGCGTVNKADPSKIFSGTAQEAYLAGKERACKVCSADSEIIVVIPDTTAQPETTKSPETAQSPETTAPPETTERYPKEYDPNGNIIVYWLENGSVWHESSSCGTVTKSDPSKIFSGTAQEAYLAGKERACKVCSADSEIIVVIPDTTAQPETTKSPETTQAPETTAPPETTERYPKEYDPNGNIIVYWLENGSVWHESSSCGTVNKSDPSKIFSGTAQEAFLSGKERACKVCSADSEITIVIPDTTVCDDTTAEETTDKPVVTDADGDVIVFWTDNGGVWHLYLDCTALSRTDPNDIFSGDIEAALSAGKERACKKCSD